MSKYAFTVHERWAVFKVHGERCYLCREPIDLRTMEVDHVIPESLLAKPTELRKVIEDFGLPDGFDVNSFENWLPACRPCNNEKRENVFEAVPIMMKQLDAARDGAGKCREMASSAVRNRDLTNALTHLERAVDRSELKAEHLMPLIRAWAKDDPDLWDQILRAARGAMDMNYMGLLQMFQFRITPDLTVRFIGGHVEIVKSPDLANYRGVSAA